MRKIWLLLSVALASSFTGAYAAALYYPVYESPLIEAKQRSIKDLNIFVVLLKTADGYLEEYQNKLQRAREIVVQGANGIYTTEDRMMLLCDLQSNLDECDRIIEHACFNGFHIFFDGEKPYRDYKVPLSEFERGVPFRTSTPNGGKLSFDFTEKDATPTYLDFLIGRVDEWLAGVSMERAGIGAFQTRLQFAVAFQEIIVSNAMSDSRDRKALRKDLTLYKEKLESRLYTLAVQGASPVYTSEDRSQILLEYKQMVRELRRFERLTGIKTSFSGRKMPSLQSRDAYEAEMLRLSKKKFAIIYNGYH